MIHPWTPFSFDSISNQAPAYGSSWSNLLLFRWFFWVPGLPPTPDNRFRGNFKWCDPINFRDGEKGETCQISGAWFPGHMMRTINDPESADHGKRVGQPFWPAPKPYKPAETRTWGEPSE